jgi:hypothetical protein
MRARMPAGLRDTSALQVDPVSINEQVAQRQPDTTDDRAEEIPCRFQLVSGS